MNDSTIHHRPSSPVNASTEISAASTSPATVVSPETPVEKLPDQRSLWVEIQRGWDWVLFVWRMTGRMGGVLGILQGIYRLLTILVKRTLTQWGVWR